MTAQPARARHFDDDKDWLAARSVNINSTETSQLFNMSPYGTEFELYHQKVAGSLGEIEENFRMKVGKAIEAAIASLVADVLGVTLKPFKMYLSNDDRMGSSFDFIVDHPGHEYHGAIIEIKNVDYLVFRDQWTTADAEKNVIDEAPPHIEIQVQHQMEMANIDLCFICAFIGGNTLKIIRRKRDRSLGQMIRTRIIKFWQDVEDGKSPEPDWERDAQFIIQLYQKAGKTAIPADKKAQQLIEEYDVWRESVKCSEFERDIRKAKLLEHVGDVDKVFGTDGFTLHCGETKGTAQIEITEDMVGNLIGGRKSFRQFRVTKKG